MQSRLNGILLDLAAKAGPIARDEQHRASAELKPDNSYVTNVDLRLSELSIEMLAEVLPRERIVTEEHLEHLEAVKNTPPAGGDEYLAFVDPIDGTRNYFHNIPLYGFSVGILKNRKPWLGLVMFPGLGEMVHCDGSNSYFVRDAFGPSPQRVELHKTDVELNFNSIMLCSEGFATRYHWDHGQYQLIQSGCATINLCWPVLGRGVACAFSAYPWDLAGSWPVLEMTGFALRGVRSGKEITAFDPSDYDPVTHRVSEPIMICRPEHFKPLLAAATPIVRPQ